MIRAGKRLDHLKSPYDLRHDSLVLVPDDHNRAGWRQRAAIIRMDQSNPGGSARCY